MEVYSRRYANRTERYGSVRISSGHLFLLLPVLKRGFPAFGTGLYRNRLLPTKLDDLSIIENTSVHNLNTRHRHRLVIPNHKHSFYKNSVTFSVISFINDPYTTYGL